MKNEVVFKKLRLEWFHTYTSSSHVNIICREFIESFFGVLPDKIEKLTIVKNPKGFIKLEKIKTYFDDEDHEFTIVWSAPTDMETTNLIEDDLECRDTYIEKYLLKLFGKNDVEVYVDIYIEYYP